MTLLQSDLLLQVPTVIHGFTTKREDLPDWGNVSLIQGDPIHALDNRAKNATTLDIPPEHLTFSLQEHGTTIRKVSVDDRGAGSDSPESSLPPADGLIANEPGLPLAIMVADCACILIAERNGQAVGAFHSGWRGTFENMAEAAVRSFQSLFGIPPVDLAAWISPMICGNCFEVGGDVWKKFEERWGRDHLLENPLRVNLPGLIGTQLVQAGIEPSNVENSGACTFEEENLFSHRRGETPNGRMMGFISIKK
ncbi:MAG: peptidoglycan editing factor PgeF [Candidatus Omnitrophica bacterium]|nr:peptidoglycan editing factor PgeF [Candidatus Omnitrophota bacterium]